MGAPIGAIDAIDVIAGGFASDLGVRGIGFVATLALIGACAGTVVGAVIALVAGLERFGFRWPTRRQAAVAATVILTVTSALFVGLCMVVPFAPITSVLGSLLAGLGVLALLWRRPTIAGWLAWPLLFVWADILGARPLYSFSRAGVATIAHATSMIVICVIGARPTPADPAPHFDPRRRHRSRHRSFCPGLGSPASRQDITLVSTCALGAPVLCVRGKSGPSRDRCVGESIPRLPGPPSRNDVSSTR